MTKEEAEAIIALSHYPEYGIVKQFQADELAKLEASILVRNYNTPQRKIDWEAGLYLGKSLFSLQGMKEQAKKVKE